MAKPRKPLSPRPSTSSSATARTSMTAAVRGRKLSDPPPATAGTDATANDDDHPPLPLPTTTTTTTTNTDRGRVPCPEFGPGWTVESILRTNTKENEHQCDKFWFSPKGRKFRSSREVERFLGENQAGAMMEDDDDDDQSSLSGEDSDGTKVNVDIDSVEVDVNGDAEGEKDDDDDNVSSRSSDDRVDPVLNTPLRNIRVKVNVSSNEIVSVRGDPVAKGEEKYVKAGDAGSDGGGEEHGAEGKEGGDPATNFDDFTMDMDIDEAVGGIEVEDVMMMDLPSMNGDDADDGASATERAVGGSISGKGLGLDYFGSGRSGGEVEAGTDNTRDNSKRCDNTVKDQHGELDSATKKAFARAKGVIFDYDSDSGGGEDPGTKDDSSYSEKSEHDDDDEDRIISGDDDKDYDNHLAGSAIDGAISKPAHQMVVDDATYNPAQGMVGMYRSENASLIDAKVRLVSGRFKGWEGRVIEGNRGWYTLDQSSGVNGSVRARDLEILEYADGTKPEVKTPSLDKRATSASNEQGNAKVDLMGATVCIRNGKHAGLKATVKERQSFRHVQLDPSIPPVHFDEVEVLSYVAGVDPKSKDLANRYMGAEVRVLEPNEYAGVEGRVMKVIIGDWYITDNPKITNAYKVNKFEILKYASGSVGAANAKRHAAAGKKEEEKQEEKKNVAATGEAKEENTVASKVSNAASGNRKSKKKGRKAKKEEAIDLTKEEDEEENMKREEEQNDAATAATTHVAPRQDIAPAAARRGRSPSELSETRSLIGATIRIKKGRFKGLTGIVNEKQSIRRLQLNTISAPLDFADVEVLRFSADADEGSDDFAKKYRKYVGADVRVLRPEEYEGMEGKVIRVIVLGDWYITDNPDIAMAFPEHKFDIINWPPGEEEDEVSCDEDDDESGTENTNVKSEEEEKIGEGKDNLKSEAEVVLKDEGEMKESSKGEEREAPSDANDWGNDGTEYHPDLPTSNNQNMMDVNGEDANIGSHDASNEVAEHDNKNASFVDYENDSLSEEDEAKEQIIHASNNEKRATKQKKDEDVGKQSNGRTSDNTSSREDADEEPSASDDGERQGKKASDEKDHNGGSGDESCEPPSSSVAIEPLIGATAYLWRGTFEGFQGKILMVGDRGWWTLDNPLITKKVNCCNCKLVDDGTFDMNAIREWYVARETRSGIKNRMPPIVKPQWVERHHQGAVEGAELKNEKDDSSPCIRKISKTDFTGDQMFSKRKQQLGVVEGGGGGSKCQRNWCAKGASQEDHVSNKRPRGPKVRDSTVPALNPIVIYPSSYDRAVIGDKKEKGQVLNMHLLPAGLRSLPPHTKIEIFNRRTGKIMRGDHAIPLSDLPAALMDHAEYEPVISRRGNSSATSRVGRSGPNVRINSDVVPQNRVRASKVEGRNVLVTGGEYQGLSGIIDSCIPGGWYLVSKLFKNDNLDVVISSRHLELIPYKITKFNSTLHSEEQDTNKICIHLKAAKLRLEVFAEERSRLERSKNDGDHRAIAPLKKLNAEVHKTSKLIDNLQLSLERSMDKRSGQS